MAGARPSSFGRANGSFERLVSADSVKNSVVAIAQEISDPRRRRSFSGVGGGRFFLARDQDPSSKRSNDLASELLIAIRLRKKSG